jgi:hypothetical protein
MFTVRSIGRAALGEVGGGAVWVRLPRLPAFCLAAAVASAATNASVAETADQADTLGRDRIRDQPFAAVAQNASILENRSLEPLRPVIPIVPLLVQQPQAFVQ